MHTVPLRPGGGCQRANRIEMPSGVLSMPVTAPSGTGLAGMEMSFMRAISAMRHTGPLRTFGGCGLGDWLTRHRLSESLAVLNGGGEILFAFPTAASQGRVWDTCGTAPP